MHQRSWWNEASFVPEALSHLSEQNLIAQLAQFPQVVETASEFREPHRGRKISGRIGGDLITASMITVE